MNTYYSEYYIILYTILNILSPLSWLSRSPVKFNPEIKLVKGESSKIGTAIGTLKDEFLNFIKN